MSPPPESVNPSQQVPDKSAAERERQRLREQERRRREAVSELCFIKSYDGAWGLAYGIWLALHCGRPLLSSCMHSRMF